MPIRTSNGAVDIEVVKVTKAQAKEWLERNEVNRPLRNRVVAAYRRDMEDGHWSFTAEPVQISRTGRLLNGQHRLTAFVTSKGVRHLELLVASGLPDETQSMMDQGVARRLTDALAMSHGHVKNVTLVASISRWMTLAPEITPQMTHSSLRGKVTTAEALSTFEKNEDIATAAERAVTYRNYIDGSPTAIGYTWLHLNRANATACNEFFAGMADMEWQWKNDPRKAALRRLQVIHRDGDVKTSLETGVMMISLLTRAWNYWRKEEEVESLIVRSRSGLIPPVTPIP
jgi:hypothetical protein